MYQGEIVKKLIKDSGLPITEIARRINVDRRTIYSYMKKDNWKPETLRQISLACEKEANYLLKKILEEDSDISQDFLNEDDADYKTDSNYPQEEFEQLNKENKKLLRKLVELQEKYIKLHEEYLDLKKTTDSK